MNTVITVGWCLVACYWGWAAWLTREMASEAASEAGPIAAASWAIGLLLVGAMGLLHAGTRLFQWWAA